ncbi:MAG: TlpA disulfide reductase family protein [Solirubrobacterales bacterium]
MTPLVLVARLVLAAVFAVAGAGKLVDRAGSREAVRTFGGSHRHAGAIALALAVVELAVAAGLLIGAAAWWAAVAALALLALFTAAMARSLRAGVKPDCRCFGRLHSAPVGPRLLARNGVLAAIAVAVVAQGPSVSSATPWPTGHGWVTLGLVLVSATSLVAGGGLVIELLRRNGRLLARVEDLEATLARAGIEVPARRDRSDRPLRAGQRAPDFTLPDLDGRPVTLSELLRPGRPLVLVFASASCAPCRLLLERLAQRRAGHGAPADPAPTVAIVGDGDRAAWRALPEELRGPPLLIQEHGEIADRYGIELTPAAVLVSPDGLVAGPPSLGAAAVSRLILGPVEETDLRDARRPRTQPRWEPLLAGEGRTA